MREGERVNPEVTREGFEAMRPRGRCTMGGRDRKGKKMSRGATRMAARHQGRAIGVPRG